MVLMLEGTHCNTLSQQVAWLPALASLHKAVGARQERPGGAAQRHKGAPGVAPTASEAIARSDILKILLTPEPGHRLQGW